MSEILAGPSEYPTGNNFTTDAANSLPGREFVASMTAAQLESRTMTEIAAVPLLKTRCRACKRVLDLLLLVPMLPVLLLVLPALMLLVKLTSKGPALFRQERVGRNGEPIRIPKLRSM